MSGQRSERVVWRVRWQIEWKWTPRDPLIWLICLAGLVLIGFCVADGWAIGAALGSAGVAFLLTVYAFLTGHFVMSSSARSRRLRGPDSGRHLDGES